MSRIDDDGPAFPVPSYVNADGETHESKPQGMSLRDYFAAKAMAAMVNCYRVHRSYGLKNEEHYTDFQHECTVDDIECCEELARDSYKFADAMLRVRREGLSA